MKHFNGRINTAPQSFTMVSNSIIKDETVSLKTLGLFNKIKYFAYIADTNSDYILYKSNIEKSCQEGRRSFNNSWQELKDKGYLKKMKFHEDGKFVYEYFLLDEPQTDKEFENYIKAVYKASALETLISINDKDNNINHDNNVSLNELGIDCIELEFEYENHKA